MRSYIKLLQSRLTNDYRIYVLALMVACVCLPHYNLWYTKGIDGPLPWVFNFFADGHLLLGKNTLFPHGPLAFFLYPLPVANNLVICAAVFILLSCALYISLFRICQIQRQENYFLFTTLMLVLLSMLDIQLLLISLTLSQTVLFHFTGKKTNLALAVFFGVFNLFIKTYGGMVCGLIVAGEFIYIIVRRRDAKLCLYIAALFFVFYYLIWLSLYHTFSGSVNFLIGQYQLSSDNSEAVAFYSNYSWFLIVPALICLLAIPFFARDRVTRYLSVLMWLPFFAAWKHAMARTDEQHMNGFLYFQVMFVFILFAVSSEKRISVVVLCLASISLFSLSLAQKGYLDQKQTFVFRPTNLYELVSGYNRLKNDYRNTSANNIADRRLPDAMLKIIGKQTADVFPWNYAIIPASGLNWAPRPVLHSYATYTSWLDERNAEHIRSEKAAQFLIWEVINPNETGNSFESIDHKYLLNDGPRSIAALFSSYRLKMRDDDFLLFEKRPKALELSSSILSASAEAAFGAWVNVPPAAKGSVTRAKVSIKKTLAGHLKSFFYKGEAFYILYEMEDKKVYVHNFVPKNAAEGLWLDPLVLNGENHFIDQRVKRIRVICPEPGMVKPTFSLAFEELRFNDPQAGSTSLQDFLFEKNTEPKIHAIFSATNHVESLSSPGKWVKEDAKKIPAEGQPSNLCYKIKPKGYSGYYSVQVINDSLPEKLRWVQFYAQARIKAPKNTSALLVVTQIGDEGINFWWYKPIYELIADEKEWSSVYFYRKVKPTDLNFEKPISFYVWNSDTANPILMDDLSVSVEAICD